MSIGEFGGAAALPREGGFQAATPMYWLYEMGHAALNPSRMAADATRLLFRNPVNPFSHTLYGKTVAAMAEMFERTTRRYQKPEWNIEATVIDGVEVPVAIVPAWSRPFCTMLHFQRLTARPLSTPQPKVLIVAPMSGHFATLLRGTVETFLPQHDVYITEWVDARMVPASEGRFDLDDYIDYVMAMLRALGPDTHVVGVCQPAVPVLAAVSLMEAAGDPCVPRSMMLMGGPIDTRCHPTAVNDLAQERGLDWFAQNVITKVPFPHQGFMRDVYPGFLQLHGFMSMNLDRHIDAYGNMFMNLVKGDGDSAQRHRAFYDEYLAVMDLSAEFYLQTIDTVFIKHALPKGEMMHRGERIDPSQIKRVALMTIEGENDDISGLGQTAAAHRLCPNIPADKQEHYMQPDVGHYGVFNGSRFRSDIAPRMAAFMRANDAADTGAKADATAVAKPRRHAVPAA